MLLLRLTAWRQLVRDMLPARVRLDPLGRPVTHAKALLVDGGTGEFSVVGGLGPVLVNGAVTYSGTLRAGDRLESADFSIEAVDVEMPPSFDASRLAAMHQDNRARAVLCDELKVQGFDLCAEFLELSARIQTRQVQARLAELIPQVGREFRSSIATSPIRRCDMEGCPGSWNRLPVGSNDNVRTCVVCKTNVTYVEDTARHAGRFALDPGVPFNPEMLKPLRIIGRPLIVDGALNLAPLIGGGGTGVLAEAAQAEHASIAVFARTICELMALGAPLQLIERTHQALNDEIRHTVMTLQQLRRLGEREPSVGPLAAATAPLKRPLDELIEDVRSGGEAEQRAVEQAHEAAAQASDPALRQFYETLEVDEARHVQLARDTVTWLLSLGPAAFDAENDSANEA